MADESPAPAAPPTARVFYAIWPDATALQALRACAARVAAEAGGRAVADANFHLTLAFVGAAPLACLDRLHGIGESIARGRAPFALTLDRLGWFRKAEVAWVGASRTPAPLQAMTEALRHELATAGFRSEPRPFKAHLTLARRCSRAPVRRAAQPIGWTVDGLTLTASELAPGGARYNDVARFALRAG